MMFSPSALNITRVPRCWRICFLVRLIMPWRLPAIADFTLPLAVILKRFFAPDLVFSLGILLSFKVRLRTRQKDRSRRKCSFLSVLIGSASPPRQPLSAGRREAGFMAEQGRKDNPNRR